MNEARKKISGRKVQEEEESESDSEYEDMFSDMKMTNKGEKKFEHKREGKQAKGKRSLEVKQGFDLTKF